jgi:CubicO group peptidase (beta-lactamase class C family)
VKRLGALILAVSLLTAIAGRLQAQPAPRDPDFSGAARAATALPQLHSLLVSWRGELVVEYYAQGRSATRLANVKSASKSIIAALVGIAIDKGLIKSVRQPIATWFPELKKSGDKRKLAITVEDLLTMRSGLESTSGGNYGAWVSSRNWVRYALDRPIVAEPGTGMEYSTGTSHLLSAILTKAAKTSTWHLAQEWLAKPLGFSLAQWPRDPQGIYFGGNEMLMTPRQMVSIGELYLRGGMARGRQVVPRAWVETSCVPRATSRWNSDRHYGYGWWTSEVGGRQTCFAWGFGGQYIMFFRDLDLVVVATSSTSVSDERYGHRRQLFDLIAKDVVGPVER